MPVVPQPGGCPACGAGGSASPVDVENLLLCDIDPSTGEVVGTAIAVYTYDDAGVPTGPPTFVIPGTNTPYVVQFMLQPCDSEGQSDAVILCDVDPTDNSAVEFVRHYIFGPDGSVASFHDSLPDGSVYTPLNTVTDCNPYRTCEPLSDVNLNGDCGPGQSPDTTLITDEGVATDSVVVDDPSADPLCGGVWDRPSEPSPFTVDESFRNATYDQPGPVTQGTAPYAGLTASPGWTGSNVDPPGQGWLQTSDINSFTNGIWQVPPTFSTANGLTAKVTFASHDGTVIPTNGDGMAFVFTDGSVPPQNTAIGGGGSLGIANWQGGYVAVVLDEYGGTGAGGNTISLQRSGGAAIPPGTGSGVIPGAVQNVNPKNLSSGTSRAAPAQLITSIITEGGQTYVSASILWPGDSEPTVYFDRFNVTAAGLPVAPATMRMALYGGSGGSYRSEHEFRDAVAQAAGRQDWRAFPITTDPIPACVTSVRVEACVDVTFTEDTQTVGNGNPEAFLWMVNAVSGTIYDKAQLSSQPSQVGVVHNICVDTTVPVAELPNLRVYVGAETRDNTGNYGTSWENLVITVAGLGCPVTPVRTLAISAPCPLDVRVIGGTSDGTPAPVTVVNTPSTFEDALICATIGGVPQAAFRREIRSADGTITALFIGVDGIEIAPDTWTPGECPDAGTPQTLGEVCYNTPLFPGVLFHGFMTLDADGNPVLYNQQGAVVPAGYTIVVCAVTTVEHEILCDFGNLDVNGDPHQFLRWYLESPFVGGSTAVYDFELDGSTTYPVVGPVGACSAADTRPLIDDEYEILCDDNGPFLRQYRHIENADGTADQSTNDFLLDGQTSYATVGTVSTCPEAEGQTLGPVCFNTVPPTVPNQPGFLTLDSDGNVVLYNSAGTIIPDGDYAIVFCSDTTVQFEVLCDQGNTGHQFVRWYTTSPIGGQNNVLWDLELDGITAYVPVGPVGLCNPSPEPDQPFGATEEVYCDTGASPRVSFIQRTTLTAEGAVLAVTNSLADGTPYVPVGPLEFGECSECCPVVVGTGCADEGSGSFTTTSIRQSDGTIQILAQGDGHVVAPGAVIACPGPATTVLSSQARLLAALQVWTPADVTGSLTGLGFTVLTGTADLSDSNGTVSAGLPTGSSPSWSAEDMNTLVPPQSITANAASTVLVFWTER